MSHLSGDSEPRFCFTMSPEYTLMSMAHFMCVARIGEFCSFEKGYHRIGSIIQTEKYLFRYAKESTGFDAFMKLAG